MNLNKFTEKPRSYSPGPTTGTGVQSQRNFTRPPAAGPAATTRWGGAADCATAFGQSRHAGPKPGCRPGRRGQSLRRLAAGLVAGVEPMP